eukprot:6183435-Pleurochrysis_carterae.AAC.1
MGPRMRTHVRMRARGRGRAWAWAWARAWARGRAGVRACACAEGAVTRGMWRRHLLEDRRLVEHVSIKGHVEQKPSTSGAEQLEADRTRGQRLAAIAHNRSAHEYIVTPSHYKVATHRTSTLLYCDR